MVTVVILRQMAESRPCNHTGETVKLVSYLDQQGRPSFGVLNESATRITDLRESSGASDLAAFIASGCLNSTSEERGTDTSVSLESVKLLPVIPNPGTIFCVGFNYADHVEETGRQITAHPTWFIRVAASQVAHNDAIVIPRESTKLDFEGEIAIVLGSGGRRISEKDAWGCIAGYACYNDGSVRDWQSATSQWTAGKNFWKTGAFGPWLVTADEIEPGAPMTLTTRLNGVEVQRASTAQLIHSIPALITHLSTIVPLRPGDVIATGTPGGVGFKRTPPLYMRAGDVVEVEVDRIGVLRNEVRSEY